MKELTARPAEEVDGAYLVYDPGLELSHYPVLLLNRVSAEQLMSLMGQTDSCELFFGSDKRKIAKADLQSFQESLDQLRIDDDEYFLFGDI